MSINSLVVVGFRNLVQGNYDFSSDRIFIVGDNGSGKSSVLESVFYLAHGKSFRTTKIDNLLNHGSESFVVSVSDDKNVRLGISRNFLSGETVIKIDDVKYSRLSELAKNIAVQIVTPESFKLFFGGPKERRKFVDLGVFHVEHSFSKIWKDFSRVLKQRNACLRTNVDSNTLSYWSESFAQSSIVISNLREGYLESLKMELAIWLEKLIPNFGNSIEVNYLQGWSTRKQLIDLLKESEQRERKQGFSQYGAQKFDVKFLIEGDPIETQLSRGQQKLFLLALTLAQTSLIKKVKQVKPILLVDDIGAELDIKSRKLLASAIEEMDCQIIMSAIDKNVLDVLLPIPNKFKMFHVEHGKLSEISE